MSLCFETHLSPNLETSGLQVFKITVALYVVFARERVQKASSHFKCLREQHIAREPRVVWACFRLWQQLSSTCWHRSTEQHCHISTSSNIHSYTREILNPLSILCLNCLSRALQTYVSGTCNKHAIYALRWQVFATRVKSTGFPGRGIQVTTA